MTKAAVAADAVRADELRRLLRRVESLRFDLFSHVDAKEEERILAAWLAQAGRDLGRAEEDLQHAIEQIEQPAP